MKAKTIRVNLIMPVWLKQEAFRLAQEKGISFSELVKDLLKELIVKEKNKM